MASTEKARATGGRTKASATCCGSFSPRGALLYSSPDITHKQPPEGIKREDLDGQNGALVCAESLPRCMIGVSLDHHVLAPWVLSPTRGD